MAFRPDPFPAPMPDPATRIVCEIRAPAASIAADLGHIAAVCARDVDQPLRMRTLPRAPGEPTLTLRLPAALAATQHEVWCLACRLACFCPGTRVSVLVLGADFTPAAPSATASRRQSQSA